MMKLIRITLVFVVACLVGASFAQGAAAPKTMQKPKPKMQVMQTKKTYVEDMDACMHCSVATPHKGKTVGKCPMCKMTMTEIRGKDVFGCAKCKTDSNKAGNCPKCKKPMTKMVMTYFCEKCKTSSSQSGPCAKCGKFRSKKMLKAG